MGSVLHADEDEDEDDGDYYSGYVNYETLHIQFFWIVI